MVLVFDDAGIQGSGFVLMMFFTALMVQVFDEERVQGFC